MHGPDADAEATNFSELLPDLETVLGRFPGGDGGGGGGGGAMGGFMIRTITANE